MFVTKKRLKEESVCLWKQCNRLEERIEALEKNATALEESPKPAEKPKPSDNIFTNQNLMEEYLHGYQEPKNK